MATITATIRAGSTATQLDVEIQSQVAIVDPVAYVQTTTVQAQILAEAGLSALLSFVSATLQSSSTLGSTYYYNLVVTYGDTPTGTTTHYHDYTTITFPIREAYRDGTTLDLDATLGPLIISYSDDVSTDYLRIRTDTGTTARDLLYVREGSITRFGTHCEFYLDATYDVGTPDAGVTLRRPRDLRISRDLYAGGDVAVTGSGSYGEFVLGTHSRFTAQAANPDVVSSHRHVYVNSGDNSLRYWDGSSEVILTPGAGGSSDTIGVYTCPGGTNVGDAVYCNNTDTVTQANAHSLANGAVVGIVVAKPTGTSANVKYVGECSVFTTLTPTHRYWLGLVAGTITDDLSAFAADDAVVYLGFARNATTLVLTGFGQKIK